MLLCFRRRIPDFALFRFSVMMGILATHPHFQWQSTIDNCSNCLNKVKNSGHRTTSETTSVQKDGTSDGCSISIVRTFTKSVDSRRLFSYTRESSQRNDADPSTLSKSAQESNSKCSSPSGNKVVPVLNVPAPLAEENVPDTFLERSVPATKDLQGSPNDIDVSARILNDVSRDVSDFPDDSQMIPASKEANDRQCPCSSKPCTVPDEDENITAQDVPNDYPSESTVRKPIYGHKGSKQISGHKSNLVRNQGPRRASFKRNVGSHGKKKKNKPTDLADISDLKFCQRKPKKTRLLSELIENDQVGGSTDAIEVDYANTIDLSESGKSIMSLQVGKDDETPVRNQKAGEIPSRAVKNKAKHTGVDNADDGSSLMNWLKKTHKKIRTEKKDSGHKNLGSFAVSNSNPDMVASNDMHHEPLPPVGDLGQENVLTATSDKHVNENAQNDSLEQNLQKADDLCQNESKNLKRRFFSNGDSTILLKRKVLSTAIAHCESNENSTIKTSMLRADDLPQMESEGTVQRCLTKVQQNLHRPLRPHPRVGVLGSLLQQDIANWSEKSGTHSGYRLGVSEGTTSFEMNRNGNLEALNSGMFSAGWNALQLGSVSSVASPEHPCPRYGTGRPWTSGNGKMVHPLDKLVRKDICVTNRNPADFTVISDKNEYMRSV